METSLLDNICFPRRDLKKKRKKDINLIFEWSELVIFENIQFRGSGRHRQVIARVYLCIQICFREKRTRKMR